MSDLLIRNIPDALKKKLAESAERSGLSLSDEAKEILRRGMVAESADPEGPVSAWDSFRSTLAVGDEEFSRIMDEIEIERKKDFGRPLESFE